MPLLFRKQPSGGRGEYELVGDSGGVSAADLDEHTFRLSTPFGIKETDVGLTHQGGKRRLRLAGDASHITRQVAAMFLLPQPTRSESAVSNALPVVLSRRYLLDVEVALEDVADDVATVRPTRLIARSGTVSAAHHVQAMDAAERLATLQALWDNVEVLPAAVGSAVVAHRALVQTRSPIDKDVERAVVDVMSALLDDAVAEYVPLGDPLPALAAIAAVIPGDVAVPAPPETPADTIEIKRRVESILRAQKARGPSASKFRKEVQAAYDFRCAFCGLRAPRVPGVVARAGVDAAHILPWGEYDLDVVQNGIMLCKQHHWAFDNHVLRLRCDAGKYYVDLNDAYAAHLDEATVMQMLTITGEIPEDCLPVPSKRPSAEFIELLYAGTEPDDGEEQSAAG